MVEKIQLAVAAHFQSLEQQQSGESAQPAALEELEEQPGEAEELVSEGAAPEEPAPDKQGASAEQYNEAGKQASVESPSSQNETAVEESAASENENVEGEKKATHE
jgi:hypothetical protein